MSFFRYEAVDRTGKIVMGTMDAPDEAAVTARLAQMGYRPHKVLPHSGATTVNTNGVAVAKPASKTQNLPPNAQRLTPDAQSKTARATAKDLALFYRQFGALVRSGISLYQSLDNLAPRTPHPDLARTAHEMAETARAGGQISNVMEKYPRLFAPHVIGSVRAGEKGGFLDIVLDEIALDYEQEIAFYKGMWLPRSMLIQGVLAIAVAQAVFPNLFPESNWPLFLRLVFLRNLPLAIGLILLVRFLYRRLQEPQYHTLRDTWALKMPVFGDLARQRSLAAFVRMLRRLFAAGVGPINAWEGAMNVAPNTVIRTRLQEAYGKMLNNVPLHEAFISTGLFANETEQLLATGVVSGQMVDMLDRIAEYYQDNVDRAFESAKFWMKRLAGMLVIVLSGLMLILLMKNYFAGVFNWADNYFKDGAQ